MVWTWESVLWGIGKGLAACGVLAATPYVLSAAGVTAGGLVAGSVAAEAVALATQFGSYLPWFVNSYLIPHGVSALQKAATATITVTRYVCTFTGKIIDQCCEVPGSGRPLYYVADGIKTTFF